MNLRLVIVVVLVVLAGLGFYFFSGDSEQPPSVEAAPAPKSDIDEILVAARDIPAGAIISDLDLKWIPFPIVALRPGMISKTTEPVVNQALKGSYARVPILEGEPIRREKLVKTTGSGFVSAVLPSGMRAMSIPIDSNGGNTAGGFVLPNDRVDVMRAIRTGESGRAELVLSDIRVIAIGKSLSDPQGQERTMQGGNATLEVTYQQARVLAAAQQIGSLFLVLRSLQDAGRETADTSKESLTIIRYGTPVTLDR